jgi:hypothetical protein
MMGLLSRLVRNAALSSDVTGPVMFRFIEQNQPTLLIDEWDSLNSGGKCEPLRNVLNSGFSSDGCTLRLERRGGEMVPVRFTTFAPLALASIGNLPATVADRSIVIPMRRKLPAEEVEKNRNFDGTELREKCLRWVLDHRNRLVSAPEPKFPRGLNDRQQDCWEPLLVLADLAGGHWGKLARDAAVALSGIANDGDAVEEMLLHDIKAVFLEDGTDRIFGKTLLSRLLKMKDGGWATASNGAALTTHKMARILSGFGIVSRTIRVGKDTDKGYFWSNFEDAWSRYLPAQTLQDDEKSLVG